MTWFEKGAAAYFMILIGLIVFALMFGGCSTLREGENRKITAWGLWAVVMGAPVGVGYWHSERGPDVESEQSAKPGLPK